MTREEAKEFIAQSVKSDVDMALVADAIKALEQEPTTKNCRTCKHFGSHHGICEICKDNRCWTEKEPTKNDLGVDCISRKAALDITWQDPSYSDPLNVLTEVRDKIRELPSVTPQEPQSFKWCTDCKEYDQEKHCCHRYSKVIRDTVAEIKQEPKTGQWIIYNYPGHECVYCSSCKEEYYEEDLYMGGSDFPKYCPNCGCRMVEPQESEDI